LESLETTEVGIAEGGVEFERGLHGMGRKVGKDWVGNRKGLSKDEGLQRRQGGRRERGQVGDGEEWGWVRK
jgi:hypothetical protein